MKPSGQKTIAVAYKRWSFTKGSNYRALPGKILVFWRGGRLREVIAHRGSTVIEFAKIQEYTWKSPQDSNRNGNQTLK